MRIAVVGDVHGHLGLLYAILGRWQRETGRPIHLILQVGDLGAFDADSPLDRATRRHAEGDPEELGFAEFAGATPPATLLDPRPPLVFIPGNHEDFELLERREAAAPENAAVYPVTEDARILGLRSGQVWRFDGPDGRLRIAGISGIEGRGHKKPVHPRVHLAERDALELAEKGAGEIDLFISHERPTVASGSFRHDMGGSLALTLLLEAVQPRLAFFGHYARAGEWQVGRTGMFGLSGCGYEQRGAGPVKPKGIVMVEWSETDPPQVEWLEPEWLAGVRLGHWRRWSR